MPYRRRYRKGSGAPIWSQIGKRGYWVGLRQKLDEGAGDAYHGCAEEAEDGEEEPPHLSP